MIAIQGLILYSILSISTTVGTDPKESSAPTGPTWWKEHVIKNYETISKFNKNWIPLPDKILYGHVPLDGVKTFLAYGMTAAAGVIAAAGVVCAIAALGVLIAGGGTAAALGVLGYALCKTVLLASVIVGIFVGASYYGNSGNGSGPIINPPPPPDNPNSNGQTIKELEIGFIMDNGIAKNFQFTSKIDKAARVDHIGKDLKDMFKKLDNLINPLTKDKQVKLNVLILNQQDGKETGRPKFLNELKAHIEKNNKNISVSVGNHENNQEIKKE